MSDPQQSGAEGDMITQQVGTNQVVHARQNSKQEIDDLFMRSLQAHEQSPEQRAWRERNMPTSFFQEPRSREPSIDQGSGPPLSRPPAGPFHHRGVSCPASISTLPPRTTVGHVRVNSYGGVLEEDSPTIPLPAGWEKAFTSDGKPYFIDHNKQVTSWEDPRKAILNQTRAPLSSASPGASGDSNVSGGAMGGGAGPRGPLPHGWEQATTPSGEPYFIDHVNKITSWRDPRLGLTPQPLTPGGGRPSMSLLMGGPPPPAPGHPFPGGAAPGGLQQLPPSHHQAMSAQQRQGGAGTPSHQRVHSHEFSNQMQRLQLEKRKTEEDSKWNQQDMMRPQMVAQAGMGGSAEAMDTYPQQGDPFLGGPAQQQVAPMGVHVAVAAAAAAQQAADFHARQESTDSGLGGMSVTLGVPKTPEGFIGGSSGQVATGGGGGAAGAPGRVGLGGTAGSVMAPSAGGLATPGVGESMDMHDPSMGGPGAGKPQAAQARMNNGAVGGGPRAGVVGGAGAGEWAGGAPMEYNDNGPIGEDALPLMNDMSRTTDEWL